MVQEIISGYNGTILTYGQTGSGKTFTIFGSRSAVNDYGKGLHKQSGIVPRAIKGIFDHIRANIDSAQFQLTVSFA